MDFLLDIIFLLPIITCFLWAIILSFRWKRNFRSQNIWILELLSMCGIMTIWFIFFQGIDNIWFYRNLDILESWIGLLFPAVIFFYFRAVTDERPFGWKEYVWLIPPLFFGIAVTSLYAAMTESQTISYLTHLLAHNGRISYPDDPLLRAHYLISFRLFNFVGIAEIVLTIIYAVLRLIRYRRRLDDFFSNLEGKSIRNNYAILIGFFLLLLLLLIFTRGHFYYNTHQKTAAILLVLWSTLQFYMSYIIFNTKFTVEELVVELEEGNRKATAKGYDASEEAPDTKKTSETLINTWKRHRIAELLLPRINKAIDEDKIFLQKDLRLDDLAEAIMTNRTYILQVLREKFNCSFSAFINQKRVEYAQELICSSLELTREEVAERSGFGHVSSFSRTFKQQTGLSFKEFQQKSKKLG